MKIERAIEILDPEHREHYESIEPVNEACRMGMEALEKQIPKRLHIVDELYHCPRCGEKDAVLQGDNYCFNCGQALDWSD